MITTQKAEAMQTYASDSSYLTPIASDKITNGVIPLDSLPADWWNWLWHNITLNEGYIVTFINSVFSEINAVLTAAGVTPSDANTTDLRDAIQTLVRTVSTTSIPGSVLSSAASGFLNVDSTTGCATINDLGTPSSVTTTAKTIVGAINELNSSLSSLSSQVSTNTTNIAKNTTNIATNTTNIAKNTTNISNHCTCLGTLSTCISNLNSCAGLACVGNITTICYNGSSYTPTNGVVNLGSTTGFPGYGTTEGCANALTGSAGSCSLVARADHVHPIGWRYDSGYYHIITSLNDCAAFVTNYKMRTCYCCSSTIMGYADLFTGVCCANSSSTVSYAGLTGAALCGGTTCFEITGNSNGYIYLGASNTLYACGCRISIKSPEIYFKQCCTDTCALGGLLTPGVFIAAACYTEAQVYTILCSLIQRHMCNYPRYNNCQSDYVINLACGAGVIGSFGYMARNFYDNVVYAGTQDITQMCLNSTGCLLLYYHNGTDTCTLTICCSSSNCFFYSLNIVGIY